VKAVIGETVGRRNLKKPVSIHLQKSAEECNVAKIRGSFRIELRLIPFENLPARILSPTHVRLDRSLSPDWHDGNRSREDGEQDVILAQLILQCGVQ